MPEVHYGQGRVAADAGATAMTDVSDGLLADLGHVADASGVGIDVSRDALVRRSRRAHRSRRRGHGARRVGVGARRGRGPRAGRDVCRGRFPTGWRRIGTSSTVRRASGRRTPGGKEIRAGSRSEAAAR